LKSIFATDFDGTLLRSDRTVCPGGIEALTRLRSAGAVTVLATGRSPFSLNRAVGGVKLPFDWLILSSGAGMISEDGDMVTFGTLSSREVETIRGFLEENRLDYSVQGPFPDSHLLYSGPGTPHPDHMARQELYRGFVHPLELLPGGAAQFVVYLDPGGESRGMELVQRVLGDRFQVIRTTSPLDHRTVWLEIFPRGVNKGAALSALAGRLGIPRSRTAALGNDWNDRHLLEWAGTAFLVSGAPEGLAPWAATVPGPDGQAVRHAAEMWMEMTR
jgi:hydroxymethylpyrimidine pyrophosphatase-like HAD family hydrolase